MTVREFLSYCKPNITVDVISTEKIGHSFSPNSHNVGKDYEKCLNMEISKVFLRHTPEGSILELHEKPKKIKHPVMLYGIKEIGINVFDYEYDHSVFYFTRAERDKHLADLKNADFKYCVFEIIVEENEITKNETLGCFAYKRGEINNTYEDYCAISKKLELIKEA